MVRLAKAAGEGQGTEVGWFICTTSLVEELHQASSPGFGGEAGGVRLVVMGCQEVMDGGQLGKDAVEEAVLPWSSGW